MFSKSRFIFIAFLLLFSNLATAAILPNLPVAAFRRLERRTLHQVEEVHLPFASLNFIEPKHQVSPFNQWEANNGYCGETSFVQAGMNQGQWMSQFNARLICGTGLSQSGPDGFCAAHGNSSNYNAQFLLESPNPGDTPFASAPLCLQNAHLAYEAYPYANQPKGLAGYQNYMSWVKAQMIAGHQVTIAILNHGGNDPQYDHEVSVTKIGTNHAVNDATYYDDDVLYFDDHTHGGTPYTQGYPFQTLGKTRADANALGANTYSILIPGAYPVFSSSGGDGVKANPHPITAANYAFAVSGPVDPAHVTLPVTLTLVGSSTNGVPNRADPVLGYNFENPAIGANAEDACTNTPPASWMGIRLEVNVNELTPGTAYNLYEYEFNQISGVGSAAALSIPDANFNAQAARATVVTHFVAKQNTYSQMIDSTSDKIIVFRCVSAQAP